jgi:hypothetical protein
VGARRDQLVLGAAAAALLVVIVAFAASGGVQEASPPPTTPTPSPAPPREQRLFGGDLAPGVRYDTRAFVPALSFEVDDGRWLARDTSNDDYLLLERRAGAGQAGGEYPGRAWLVFSRLPLVHDPRRGRLTPTPSDLYRWTHRHPDLAVGPRMDTTVAGVPGYEFAARVWFRRPAVFAPVCILPDVPCTAIAPNRSLLRGARMRTLVLPPARAPLVIDVVGATQRDLDEVEVPAAQVLRTLRLTRP